MSTKVVGLVVGTLILAGTLPVAKRNVDPTETVTEVIDGDTFKIDNNQTVRLYRIDAPEIGNCFSMDAKTALEKKILNKKVIIKSPRTDYFKRVQGYVYVDNEFVNEYVSLNGYGVGRESGENDEDKIIATANKFARDNKVGIYSEECYPSKPKNPNCLIKGNVTYDGTARVYRFVGCRDYSKTVIERFRGDDYFCSEKEAIDAGFTKAVTCK